MVYDEQLPVLDDSFEGDEVVLLAVRGGRVDKTFRRNYAWAKHAADTGKLKQIVVVVALGRDSWLHTVSAVTSALSGAKLHRKARFKVDSEVSEIGGDKLTKVLAALDELAAPKLTFSVGNLDEVKAVRPKPKPPVVEPKGEDKGEAKEGE
ncbi:holin [Mycobacterium phage Bromden]|uniref:Uncharacterized protein n=1 Tax=Mycobacterium phage Bromden TaxID=2283252 RepID=A0A345MBG4_9CAUD|nr:holin [Mycobacterium phage Bromden]AXH67835.1 hypothetical protein SEA_BROMDEN_29 [Mycobacterium phage Bromden]